MRTTCSRPTSSYVAHERGIHVNGVADQLGDSSAASGIRKELGDRTGVAVVQRAHAVEQVGDRRAGAALGLHLREMLTRVGQGLASLHRVGIGVSPGRQRSPIDEGFGNRPGSVGARLLGGKRHGQRVALAVLDEGARQVRVGIDDKRRILGSAALVGDERALEVDASELVGLRQLGQGLCARTQHLGGGGHAGCDQGGRAVTAMLEDRNEGFLGGLGVGEGLSAAAVAVHIDEAGQVGRIAGLGRLTLVLGNGTYTGNSRAVELDNSVLNDGIFQNQTATQHRSSHALIVAHMTLHCCVSDNHFSQSSNALAAGRCRDSYPFTITISRPGALTATTRPPSTTIGRNMPFFAGQINASPASSVRQERSL